MQTRVLLIEDDKALRFWLSHGLRSRGFEVETAASIEDARTRFLQFDPHVVVTDYQLEDGDALEIIGEFRRVRPALPIFVLTGFGSIERAVRAVKNGADDFFTKPIDLQDLAAQIREVCAPKATDAPPPPEGRIGVSPKMRALEEDIERVKDAECSLLILGETGTGKTLLARRLHESSRRRDKPFMDLNCAGLAPDLVESELFGHERGAFTSANAPKPGVFEIADGGTLFLDEIGDIGIAVQPKILKAVEEKRFRRMGSIRERGVDVRVIAATHKDLRALVRTGDFRVDLYYRLNTMTLTVPALRERPEDIPQLARELLTTLATSSKRNVPELAPDAEALLLSHRWPGNIRELKNVLERGLHYAGISAAAIHARHLQVDDFEATTPSIPATRSTRLEDLERAHIEQAIAGHESVTDAARSLGISRSSLYLKLKAYGIQSPNSANIRAKMGERNPA